MDLLVIEEKKIYETLMAPYLTRKGIHGFWVKDIQDLVSFLKNQKVDCVIISMDCKEIDPLEALQVLLKESSISLGDMIATTSRVDPEIMGRFHFFGVEHFFIQPYDFNDVISKIDFIIKSKSILKSPFDPFVMRAFLESTMLVFKSLANISLVAGTPFVNKDQSCLKAYYAVIQIYGQGVKGSLCLFLDRFLLVEVLKAMIQKDGTHPDDESLLLDVCGEILNQVVGLAKQRFLTQRHIDFEIGIPEVYKKTDLASSLSPIDHQKSVVIPFLLNSLQVACVQFNFQMDPRQVKQGQSNHLVFGGHQLLLF